MDLLSPLINTEKLQKLTLKQNLIVIWTRRKKIFSKGKYFAPQKNAVSAPVKKYFLEFELLLGYDSNGFLNILSTAGLPSEVRSIDPKLLRSKYGFQGCLANVHLNGESPDLIQDALLPSTLIVAGCEGNCYLKYFELDGIFRI